MLDQEQIQNLRKNYRLASLDEADLHADPFIQFNKWFTQALSAELTEPNAMQLGTVGKNQQPDIRTVLLKGVDNGFVFYTNYHSEKGQHLEHNPKVALHFLWLELERQVRIHGTVEKLSDKENDTYFNSRPFESRVGAIASHQSKVLPNRQILEDSYLSLLSKDPAGIQRPEYWGGYRVIPDYFEFWQGRESRLHDRVVFNRELNNDWRISRLYP